MRSIFARELDDGRELLHDDDATSGWKHLEHTTQRRAEAEAADEDARRHAGGIAAVVGIAVFEGLAGEAAERELGLERRARQEHDVAEHEIEHLAALPEREHASGFAPRTENLRHVYSRVSGIPAAGGAAPAGFVPSPRGGVGP